MPSDDHEPHTVLEEAIQSFLHKACRRLPHNVLLLRAKGERSQMVGFLENSRGSLWEQRGLRKQGKEVDLSKLRGSQDPRGRAQDLSGYVVGLQTPLRH